MKHPTLGDFQGGFPVERTGNLFHPFTIPVLTWARNKLLLKLRAVTVAIAKDGRPKNGVIASLSESKQATKPEFNRAVFLEPLLPRS